MLHASWGTQRAAQTPRHTHPALPGLCRHMLAWAWRRLRTRAGLSPSLLGNALSWGLYWVAWKSIHTWWCEYTQVKELSWSMKLLTGMQAGASGSSTAVQTSQLCKPCQSALVGRSNTCVHALHPLQHHAKECSWRAVRMQVWW